MYIQNGIAYAGERIPPLKIVGVKSMPDYRLWVRFNTGEAKTFDCKQLLDTPAFSPLKNQSVFNSVYIDYGVPAWNDGTIDIAPEYLFEHGVTVE